MRRRWWSEFLEAQHQRNQQWLEWNWLPRVRELNMFPRVRTAEQDHAPDVLQNGEPDPEPV